MRPKSRFSGIVRWVALAVVVYLFPSLDVEAAISISIGPPSPNPGVQGSATTFTFSILSHPRIRISGTVLAEVINAGCSLQSCRVALPAVDLHDVGARVVQGQLSTALLPGRRTYTLHAQFRTADSSVVAHAFRDFYVEIPDEQSDTFRNGVDVDGNPGPASFCASTNYGWRFERDEDDRLRAFQPTNQCTGQPQNAWMTLGSGHLASSPALSLSYGTPVNQPNDRIHLFYRGKDGLLWTWVWDGKPLNSDPMSLGGPITSAPAAISPTDLQGRVEVFYRGLGSQLISRSLDGGHSWGEPKVLATAVDSAPAAYSFRSGIDIVVFRGANKRLWLISRDRRTNDPALRNNTAPWTPPSDLGGVALRSSPGIARKSDNSRVTVEYRGPDDKVWESSWDGKSWWSAPYDTKLNP